MNKNDIEEDPKIVKLLKSYNESQEIEAFNSQVFECIICFAEKLGKNCLQFAECQHVFCNECMRSHFDVKISQGELKKHILKAGFFSTFILDFYMHFLFVLLDPFYFSFYIHFIFGLLYPFSIWTDLPIFNLDFFLSQKEKENTFTLLIIFIVKSLQKEQNNTNLLLRPLICQNKHAITPK